MHLGFAWWYNNLHQPRDFRLVGALQAISTGWDNSVPIDDYRSLAKALEVMREYSDEYAEESFTVVGAPAKPVVEQTFTLALGTYLSCDCGDDESSAWVPTCSACNADKEPIEYGGIFDTLIEFNNKVFILEHKTTSQLGDYYFNQFKPNNQITGYIWAARQLSGLDVAGAMVNAIGVYKTSKTKFKRQIVTRDDRDIEQWVRNVTATCEEIKAHQRKGFWPQRTMSCTQYGLCEFHQVCLLSDPHWRQKRLEQDYERREWDYTKRDEGDKAE